MESGVTSSDHLQYELTAHARHVVIERGISLEWISLALQQPARVEDHRTDSELKSALVQIAEFDNRVRRGVYNDHTLPWKVVTACFD